MGTTKIHPIKDSPKECLRYCMSDKQEDYKNEEDMQNDSPHEVVVDPDTGAIQIHFYTQTSFVNCDPSNPYLSFQERQLEFQGKYQNSAARCKDGKEPLMYHLVQSFDGWEVDTFTANEIGVKLAEELFGDYVCTISTHGNTDNVHNHILISAWDSEGRKLNDCNALVNQIREVSDRLCEEYGLRVLEETRTMKLSTYKDKDGNTHKVEMTDRKKGIVEDREEGFTYSDDVNSYRHSEAYAEKEQTKKTNAQEIREDIDMLIPKVKSYEQLLDGMRELGYTVKDRRKDGEWLAHVSFKGKLHKKATRDSSLSKDGFYERENLTEYIRKLVERIREEELQRRKEEEKQQVSDTRRTVTEEENYPAVEYFEKYEHGVTDISKVHEKYKAVKDSATGKYKTVRRTPFEEKTVGYLKRSYDRLDRDSRIYHITKKDQKLTPAQKAELINRIVKSWNCLKYCENNNLLTYNQMFDLYQSHKKNYDTALARFTTIETTLNGLAELRKECDRIVELEQRMESNRGNIAYTFGMYPDDKREYDRRIQELHKHKLGTAEERNAFFGQIDDIEKEQRDVRAAMSVAIYQMKELENCVQTLSHIDREAGINTSDIEKQFGAIRRTDNSKEKKRRDRS